VNILRRFILGVAVLVHIVCIQCNFSCDFSVTVSIAVTFFSVSVIFSVTISVIWIFQLQLQLFWTSIKFTQNKMLHLI